MKGKMIKGILRVEVQERSFNFDGIEMRIVESKNRIERISLGIAGKKPSLFFTEDQLLALHESLVDYFKIKKEKNE